MSSIGELKQELEQLRAKKHDLDGDKLQEIEAEIRRAQRKIYEAGPHHSKWVRLQARTRAEFVAAIDAEKPKFEFVRMILTSAVLIAVTIFFWHQMPTAADGWIWALIWSVSMLGLLGLSAIVLRGAYDVAVRFALPVAASIADQVEAPFSRGVVKFAAWGAALAVLGASLTLGVTFGKQAIKQTPAVADTKANP